MSRVMNSSQVAFSAAQPLQSGVKPVNVKPSLTKKSATTSALKVDFQTIKPTAKGSFGDIFFAKLRNTQEPIVLKRAGQAPLSRKLLIAERNVNKSLNLLHPHPTHWPKYLGETNHNSESFLVWRGETTHVATLHEMLFERAATALPLALGVGSFACNMHTNAPVMDVQLFKALTKALLNAVNELHQSGFVHRDIKPHNILVTANTPCTPHQLKLIDFGSAKRMQPWATLTDRTPVTLDPLFGAPERGGLLFDTAPKQLKSKFDVFSIGMIAIAAAVPALRGEAQLRMFRSALESHHYDLSLMEQSWLENGRGGHLEALFLANSGTEQSLKSVLRAMLKKQPHTRVGVQTALQQLEQV